MFFYLISEIRLLILTSHFTECGMEFQIETPVLVPDFIVFSFLENFTEKLSFVDDLVL